MSHDKLDHGATPPACPRCGGRTARVHRRTSDHWFASLRREPVLRFQCRSATCGWSGLLAPNASAGGARRLPLVAVALMALLVAAATVGLVAFTSDSWGPKSDDESLFTHGPAGLRPQLQDAHVQVPPAGWHDVGQALPADDARRAGSVAGLHIRHGCTWGVPGRDPYRGTAEQALQAAGLPDDAVRTIAQRIRRGESDGEVTLARDGIRSADGQRQFGRRLVASTYGMTLCFDTLVNFEDGHVERAPLFEFTSADGRRFSVIVPEVCGNVGVIAEQPAAGIVLGERAERSAGPAVPGTTESPASPGAPGQAGPGGNPVPLGAPNGAVRGRPTLPAPPMGGSHPVPPPGGTTPPTTPVGRTPPTPETPSAPPTGTEQPPVQPPPVQPPRVQPPPVQPPPVQPPPVQPPPVQPPPVQPPPVQPPPVQPPPVQPPPVQPPPVQPPPVQPPPVQPPPVQPPPVQPPPMQPPPVKPPPVQPPPVQPPPVQPPPMQPPPLEPPPGPPEPDWLPPLVPPPEIDPPPFIPGDPDPPRPVPAPGTLSTGLLGLAALMLSRHWRRRRRG